VIERPESNIGDTARDCHICQTGAIERVRVDASDCVWNCDMRQAGASGEGANVNYSDAIGNRDACQISAIDKRRILDIRDAVGDCEADQVAVGVSERPDAGNPQGADCDRNDYGTAGTKVPCYSEGPSISYVSELGDCRRDPHQKDERQNAKSKATDGGSGVSHQ
jgi:hypothetical protein